MEYLACALMGYLLGNINLAYFLGKAKGFDIRSKGSNNPGASNAAVVMGLKSGAIVALFDIFKAYFAVIIAGYLFKDNELIQYLAGAFCIIGHMFPFYMGFKGGKGFASYLGVVLAFDLRVFCAFIILSLIITFLTDYIALATISVVIIYPVYMLILGNNPYTVLLMGIVSLIIISKHFVNIKKIISGSEIGLRKGVLKK